MKFPLYTLHSLALSADWRLCTVLVEVASGAQSTKVRKRCCRIEQKITAADLYTWGGDNYPHYPLPSICAPVWEYIKLRSYYNFCILKHRSNQIKAFIYKYVLFLRILDYFSWSYPYVVLQVKIFIDFTIVVTHRSYCNYRLFVFS